MFQWILQEWWGVTDDLKEIATDISKRKYRALIPDMYKGEIGVEAEEAKHVRSAKLTQTGLCYRSLTSQLHKSNI